MIDGEKEFTSNEGNLKWFRTEEIFERELEMPFSAYYVVRHYAEVGKNTDALYVGAATESGITFTEMKEF